MAYYTIDYQIKKTSVRHKPKKNKYRFFVWATLFLAMFWLIHLRLTEIEKIRCEVWDWKICQDLN